MKSISLFILLLSFTTANYVPAQVEVIKLPQLTDIIQAKAQGQNEDISIINFWATWCGPCVKELPYFEQLTDGHSSEELKVYLISLDDVDKLESRVEKFVAKKQLKSEVKLLDETDYNSWINKVEPEWSGAIPATIIINHKTGQRMFHEGELTKEQLVKLVDKTK